MKHTNFRLGWEHPTRPEFLSLWISPYDVRRIPLDGKMPTRTNLIIDYTNPSVGLRRAGINRGTSSLRQCNMEGGDGSEFLLNSGKEVIAD